MGSCEGERARWMLGIGLADSADMGDLVDSEDGERGDKVVVSFDCCPRRRFIDNDGGLCSVSIRRELQLAFRTGAAGARNK